MAPNPKVVAAFRAMSCLGIEEHKVKPVLKKLLKLYDKNWELIEEENYRALADAIFDEDDNQVYNYTISCINMLCIWFCLFNLFTVLYHLTGVGARAGKEKQG